MRVVGVTRALEVGAQVEQWRGQNPARHQQKRDEQASDAAVTVEEGVDRLEVGVGDGGVHERWEGLVVEEPLPGIQARHQFLRRRRDIGRVVQGAARRSDPVLAAPELARRRHVPADAPHEVLMQLTHEAQRDWQRREALQTVLEGGDVVAHLAQVVGAAVDGAAGLGRQQLAEGRLRPFNAAGEDGFLAHKGADEEVRVGKTPSLAREPADGPVRSRQVQREALVPRQRWRGRSRHEGAVAPGAVHQATVRLSLSVRQGAAPC